MKLSDRNDVNAGNTRVLGRALPAGGVAKRDTFRRRWRTMSYFATINPVSGEDRGCVTEGNTVDFISRAPRATIPPTHSRSETDDKCEDSDGPGR